MNQCVSASRCLFLLHSSGSAAKSLPSVQFACTSVCSAAASSQHCRLRLVLCSSGSGMLHRDLSNSLRMVTGNLFIAMETWSYCKLFHFALGHIFGAYWLGGNSYQILGSWLCFEPQTGLETASFIPEK